MNKVTSLLFPEGAVQNDGFQLDRKVSESLGLDTLLRSNNRHSKNLIHHLISTPSKQPEVIEYRLDVTEDLLAHADLATGLWGMIPKIGDLVESSNYNQSDDEQLLKLIWRFKELESYTECIAALRDLMSVVHEEELRSVGLRTLRRRIVEETETPEFRHLLEHMQLIRPGLDRMGSVTIGVNLNTQLEPIQATLLSFQEERFKDGSSVASKVLSLQWYSGFSKMHTDPAVSKDNTPFSREINGLRKILFRDLKKVLKEVIKPVEALLGTYTRLHTQWLTRLGEELAFYMTSVQYTHQLREAGMPVCRPRIVPMEQRVLRLKELYNPLLVIRQSGGRTGGPDQPFKIVTNEIDFDENGRIYLLTGPNSGGKTIFAQAVGIVQALSQIGMFVPCREAVISPVDTIQTQFEVEEQPIMEAGKLGVESAELHKMFAQCTAHSLVLLNETFSSTSPGESMYLMKDLVYAFRMAGVRGVFTTHLHELAAQAEKINGAVVGDSKVVSLVAGIRGGASQDGNRTYIVKPGPPQGMSYAKDIADRYGISFEQLKELLDRRAKTVVQS